MTTFSPTSTLANRVRPRVAVFSYSSCFGCQLQITNKEQYLMDVVGQIDLVFWGMASSAPLPEDYDVAVIEGALTTTEALEQVRQIRNIASTVITIGSCANTTGLPGIASGSLYGFTNEVYGAALPDACLNMTQPVSVCDVIDVDFRVHACPIDFYEFVDVLQQSLMGSNKRTPSRSMCGDCKRNEAQCFYERGEICLGLVTRAGCHAKCVSLGRECMGCRGLSPAANLLSARQTCINMGFDPADFDRRLSMFNNNDPLYKQYMSAVREREEA